MTHRHSVFFPMLHREQNLTRAGQDSNNPDRASEHTISEHAPLHRELHICEGGESIL